MRLKIQTPDGDSRRVAIANQHITLGRDEENDIVLLNDSKASGRHARIEVTGERCQILDLGSTNGVIINGETITPHEPLTIKVGQSVKIGLHRIELVEGGLLASLSAINFSRLPRLAQIVQNQRLRTYGFLTFLVLLGTVIGLLINSFSVSRPHFDPPSPEPAVTTSTPLSVTNTPSPITPTAPAPPATSTLVPASSSEGVSPSTLPRFIPADQVEQNDSCCG